MWGQISKMGLLEIGRSYDACLRILLAAGGAGLITAATVVFKTMILHSPLNPVTGGLLGTLNFALSFLFMQALGFRLATKVSPLLGAALARRWEELRSARQHSIFRNEVLWSFYTQLMAAMGNLFFVIPAAVAFHFAFRLGTGRVFLDSESAHAMLASLNPWNTGTLAYAIFTGGLLWLCTLAGGAFAHRVRPFSKHVATAAFNILLGALLALTPILGKFLGLPLDVRHFTLSGGYVALAVATLGVKQAWTMGLGAAFVGVLAIGILNGVVSFTLAFITAARAGLGSANGLVPSESHC